MSRLIVGIIILVVLACPVPAQLPTQLNASITLDDPILQRGRDTVVHVKIKWGAVPNARAETLREVYLRLTKPENRNRCTRGQCLGATFWLPTQITPKPGEVVEFDVVLNSLYWYDIISSQQDSSQPKNLFSVVPGGSYSLVLSAYFEANYSRKGDRRVIEVASNSVTVQVS